MLWQIPFSLHCPKLKCSVTRLIQERAAENRGEGNRAGRETEEWKFRVLAGLKTIAVRISGGNRRRKKRRPTKVVVVQDKLMELWQKMVFPVRRLWFAVSTRVKSRNNGGLLKLHNDVQTCGYEDVQVMWEMLRRSESEVTTAPTNHRKPKNRPFWRVFVWSNHNSAAAAASLST